MMQNFGNRRSVQKYAQNAGSNVLKYTMIVLIALESCLWRTRMWHIQLIPDKYKRPKINSYTWIIKDFAMYILKSENLNE